LLVFLDKLIHDARNTEYKISGCLLDAHKSGRNM
jgi:hypothetical protein